MLLLSEEMASMMKTAAELGRSPTTTLMPPAEGRAQTAPNNRSRNASLPEMATVADIWVGGGRPRALTPSGAASARAGSWRTATAGAILFVHGGGFAFGSPESHERSARAGAGNPYAGSGCRITPAGAGTSLSGRASRTLSLACAVASAASASAEIAPGSKGCWSAATLAGANLALAAMLHEQAAGRAAGFPARCCFYGCYARNFTTPCPMRISPTAPD